MGMKLVVGLGNPGAEYRDTRHNVGFQVVDELARRWGVDQWREAFESLASKTVRNGEPVLLCKPLTFMNLSGRAVGGLMRYFKIGAPDVLIVTDDVSLPLGRLRARGAGSEGGHNGLRSIAAELSTTEYPRLRVGVGRGDTRRDLADHVLGMFAPEEQPEVQDAVTRAADAVETWVVDGLAKTMNVFNRGN
jgi:PTH1 family peptidyl-tRNA hydrolase